jgi:hypothetical protein
VRGSVESDGRGDSGVRPLEDFADGYAFVDGFSFRNEHHSVFFDRDAPPVASIENGDRLSLEKWSPISARHFSQITSRTQDLLVKGFEESGDMFKQ